MLICILSKVLYSRCLFCNAFSNLKCHFPRVYLKYTWSVPLWTRFVTGCTPLPIHTLPPRNRESEPPHPFSRIVVRHRSYNAITKLLLFDVFTKRTMTGRAVSKSHPPATGLAFQEPTKLLWRLLHLRSKVNIIGSNHDQGRLIIWVGGGL